MPTRSDTSLRRRSLRLTVQPETSPFRWAKSIARTTSPTQHVYGRRAFATADPSAWNGLPVRAQFDLDRCCYQAPAQDISVRTVTAHRARGVLPVMRCTNPHNTTLASALTTTILFSPYFGLGPNLTITARNWFKHPILSLGKFSLQTCVTFAFYCTTLKF